MRQYPGMDDDARTLLDIYLHDHMAGAVGGRELARRLAEAESETDFGTPLRVLCEDIEQDRDALQELVRALGMSAHAPAKEAAAWVAEKFGRLKLNGRWVTRSPLSLVLELEGLQAGITAKLCLWRSMEALRRRELVPPLDFDGLIARAEHQRAEAELLHGRAVELAFTVAK